MTAFFAVMYTLLIPGILVVLIPWLMLRGYEIPAIEWWYRHAGWPLVAAGVAMITACTALFVIRGHGTPSPGAPPQRLVVTGLFRWTRNPMYLGIVSVLLGLALLLWSPVLLIYTVCVWMVMELHLHLFEEPALRRRFGEDYDTYRQSTPRWLGWPLRGMTRHHRASGRL